MSATKIRKIISTISYLSIGLIGFAYADNTSSFTVSATVTGGDNIYCPQSAGSNGAPNPGLCGTINFGTFNGTQEQQTLVATVTTNDPTKDATLSIADSVGGNYALKNTVAPTQTIPLAIQYTDCSGNNYGSTSNSTLITSADITGSSISGANPACTSYNTYPPSGTHGTFTFTVPTIATLPQDGSYTETLNVTISSM